MGTEIRRVPPAFQHPLDDEGNPVPGAHLEPLYNAGASHRTGPFLEWALDDVLKKPANDILVVRC